MSLFLILILTAFHFRGSGRTFAQDAKTKLDSEINIDSANLPFAMALRTVSEQSGLNIVALDEPRVSEHALKFRGTARQALDAIGSRFDYSWKQTFGGAIVLTKRFTKVGEHPQFSAEEGSEYAKAVRTHLASLGVQGNPGRFADDLRRLFVSMSAHQRLQASQDPGMPVRELDGNQKSIVVRAVIDAAFGALPVLWAELESQLRGLASSTIGVRSQNQSPGVKNTLPKRINQLNGQLDYTWKAKSRVYRSVLPHDSQLLLGPEVVR